MKIIRRTLLSVFCLCLVFCAFSFASSLIKIKAWFVTPALEIMGAQVRTEGDKTGIRFVGKVTNIDEIVQPTKYAYGFLIAYGETEEEITFDTTTINERSLIRAEVDEVDSDGYFYATIFNIPETKYIQAITAKAYSYDKAKSTDSYLANYSVTQVTRNLATLTNLALNDGCTGTILTNVKNYMASNYKVLDSDSIGNTYMLAPTYEYNVNRLFVEFMSDVNEFAESEIFIIDDCKSSLSYFIEAFIASCENVERVYRPFFMDDFYGDKWYWLFNGLYSVDGLSNNTKYQLDYVLSKMSNRDDSDSWNSGHDLSIFLYDFFTQSSFYEGKAGKDFGKQKIFYSNIIRSNNKIYSMLDSYEFTGNGTFPTLVNIDEKDVYELPETSSKEDYETLYVILGDEVNTLVDSGSKISSDRNIVCSEFLNCDGGIIRYQVYNYEFKLPTIKECLQNVCEGGRISCCSGTLILPTNLDINNITISGLGMGITVLIGSMQLKEYSTGITFLNLTLKGQITNTTIEESTTELRANVSDITFNMCQFLYSSGTSLADNSFVKFVDGDMYYTENVAMKSCVLSADNNSTGSIKYLNITNCYNLSITDTHTTSTGNGDSIYIGKSNGGIGFAGEMNINNCIFDNYDTIYVQRFYHSDAMPLYVSISNTGNKFTGHPFLTFRGMYCPDAASLGAIPNENNLIFTDNYKTNSTSGSNVLPLDSLFHAVDFDYEGYVSFNGVKTHIEPIC